MAKNQFFELAKSLKLPKMQFHKKIFYLIFMKNMKFFFREIDLFDFTSFLPEKFLARYAMKFQSRLKRRILEMNWQVTN